MNNKSCNGGHLNVTNLLNKEFLDDWMLNGQF